jgi:hypothetical protein
MAKSAEMNAKAKDIAALFRSAVEAEDEDLLCDTSTFAEQDFFIQLGWFTNQIEARLNLKKNTPSPDVLALMAALGGAIGSAKPKDCIDKAYETWQASDAKIRAATLCSREEIEENLSQVGWEFRLAPWKKNIDGTNRMNLDLGPFLRLCLPPMGQDALEARFKEYLTDNRLGDKPRTTSQVERELSKIKAKKFVPDDLHHEGALIVKWWMTQDRFEPLSFLEGSHGYAASLAFGFIKEKEEQ